MKRQSLPLLAVAAGIALAVITRGQETAKEDKRVKFLPAPLGDEWSKWIVGEWEGSGTSDTGRGQAVTRIELALNGQFLISHGEAKIMEITPEQVSYLKKNMHASDEEIERFQRAPYRAMEMYTIDQVTGEVVGYLFDSLRCMAKGKGRRQGNRQIMQWEWATGHRSTRITEKVSNDRCVVIQRTPMPDGSVMEEKGEMTRRKDQPVPKKR